MDSMSTSVDNKQRSYVFDGSLDWLPPPIARRPSFLKRHEKILIGLSILLIILALVAIFLTRHRPVCLPSNLKTEGPLRRVPSLDGQHLVDFKGYLNYNGGGMYPDRLLALNLTHVQRGPEEVEQNLLTLKFDCATLNFHVDKEKEGQSLSVHLIDRQLDWTPVSWATTCQAQVDISAPKGHHYYCTHGTINCNNDRKVSLVIEELELELDRPLNSPNWFLTPRSECAASS